MEDHARSNFIENKMSYDLLLYLAYQYKISAENYFLSYQKPENSCNRLFLHCSKHYFFSFCDNLVPKKVVLDIVKVRFLR